MSSLAAYEAKQTEIKKLLKQLDTALLNHDRQGSREPGGHQWGYVGDLEHVAQELTNICKFLAGKDDW
jgi:hypothetical protein